MIVKQKTSPPSTDTMRKAGDAAEKQMAFYLKRRYAEDANVLVFNDLRIERAGEVAQIDHLLMHRHGLIIVESKSVTGKVRINEHGEFVRVFGRKQTGMPSPIQQAKRQGDLLRRLLNDHREQLLQKKFLGIWQTKFMGCPVDVLVAVSDQGIIDRSRENVPELHKADQIVDAIDAIIRAHRKGAKLLAHPLEEKGLYSIHPDDMRAISDFLTAQHVERVQEEPAQERPAPEEPQQAARPPRTSKRAAASAAAEPPAMPTYLCTHCHSTNLEIRYGRSYYFKCLDCDGNTALKNACRECGGFTRTQKRGAEFTAICRDCGHTELFFRNPMQADH
jgi:hypothetical protein